ncbi:MAG: flagellar basal body protein, partial [Alphaproteobacteria bacterium]|nr:flagellar basal body protein [Alphaproteobacteria bacterium]
MSTVDPLTIAMSGLSNINRGLAVVSQNIANANTPGYVHESLQQQAVGAGDLPMGVTTGVTTRDIDLALQARLATQNASAGEAAVRSEALAQIDAMQGKPGDGTDLVALLGNVSASFSTLLSDPASVPQQQAVVDQAGALAAHLRDGSALISSLRQTAQDRLVRDVGALNDDLTAIGNLSRQIINVRAAGASTADLENQRDAVAMDASKYIELSFVPRPNGDMTVFTPSGLQLPTTGRNTLNVQGASLGPSSYYPGGGVPGVMLNGVDVTASLRSGTIGGAIDLRDTTLPTDQAMLDEFALTLQTRFGDQGLGLFTDSAGNFLAPAGAPPRQAPYVGYAGQIVVNPAVAANPSLVRDGTGAIIGTPGGPQSFTPNPPGGPSGFTTLIKDVLDYTFGTKIAPGATQSS